MNYPLHLGVTEAGDGEDARIKSAIGIGSLLLDGLGDTLRVSLTEDPVAKFRLLAISSIEHIISGKVKKQNLKSKGVYQSIFLSTPILSFLFTRSNGLKIGDKSPLCSTSINRA